MPSFGKILCAVFQENSWRADQRTNEPTIPTLTSTDVENCNLLSQLSQLQNLTSWLNSNFDFFSVGSYQCHLWQFVISDQFNHPKSIKQPKTLFLAHFAIWFCVNAYSNLTFVILMKISTSISFLSITISNISHMETAKVRRMTKNFIFGSLNHSKNAFLQCLNDPSCTGNSAGCYKT